MKIYLDTAELDEIKEISKLGIIEGVTTNPSIIAKSGTDIVVRIKEITEMISVPVSVEVSPIHTTAKEMIEEGRKFAKINPNVVVKIPMTYDGLIATNKLNNMGIKTNVTLIFTVSQALIASKAGATYVSPFVGRLDDINQDGLKLIRDIRNVFDLHRLDSEIIAASIRNNYQFLNVATAGAHIATVPPILVKELLVHPLTTEGLKQFKADYLESKK